MVGFDDIYPGALADPGLTTVRQPMRALGEHACARLLERLAAPRRLPVRVEVLPTEMVLRESCGCRHGAAGRSVVTPFRAPAAVPAEHRAARRSPPASGPGTVRSPGTARSLGTARKKKDA